MHFVSHKETAESLDTFHVPIKYHIQGKVTEDFMHRSLGSEVQRRLDVVLHGLLKEKLVDVALWGMYVRPDNPIDFFEGTREFSMPEHMDGIVFRPSVIGIDLFLRAQGRRPKKNLTRCFEEAPVRIRPEEVSRRLMEDIRAMTIEEDDQGAWKAFLRRGSY